MDCTSITIVLELDGTGDRPFGIARLADGTSRTFHGWLGLVEAIDALAIPTAPTGFATPVAVSRGEFGKRSADRPRPARLRQLRRVQRAPNSGAE